MAPARKKTPLKKAAKKAVVKKKAVAKKKAAKKKSAAARKEPNVTAVLYHCGPNCTAFPDPRHMFGGDLVILYASNTDVTIDFSPNPSPFVSGNPQITLNQGDIVLEIVREDIPSNTTFNYILTCSACGSLFTPPSMIVD